MRQTTIEAATRNIKILVGFVFVAFHFLTVWMASDLWGFFGFLLTLELPVFAQLLLMCGLWYETGVFFNQFTLYCLGFVSLCIVAMFVILIIRRAEN